LIAIICLFVLIGAAAIYQMTLASRDGRRFPGPNLDTPFPTTVITP
jgi:hypothetical protein